jgi:hypothetical protein
MSAWRTCGNASTRAVVALEISLPPLLLSSRKIKVASISLMAAEAQETSVTSRCSTALFKRIALLVSKILYFTLCPETLLSSAFRPFIAKEGSSRRIRKVLIKLLKMWKMSRKWKKRRKNLKW